MLVLLQTVPRMVEPSAVALSEAPQAKALQGTVREPRPQSRDCFVLVFARRSSIGSAVGFDVD